jgi:hypothetical protein
MGAEAVQCIAMGGQLELGEYGYIITAPDSKATSITGAEFFGLNTRGGLISGRCNLAAGHVFSRNVCDGLNVRSFFVVCRLLWVLSLFSA